MLYGLAVYERDNDSMKSL